MDKEFLGALENYLKPSEKSETALEAPVEKRTYTVAQTAAILDVHPTSIYGLIQLGYMQALKGLRHKKIPCKQVHDYADGKVTEPIYAAKISTSASRARKRRARRKRTGPIIHPRGSHENLGGTHGPAGSGVDSAPQKTSTPN